MLQLLEPEDYDERYAKWNMDDIPIVHVPWRKKPSGDARSKAQLKIILSLLKQAKGVIHAGDPDDEGQLLVDEILEYANCRLPVQRVLINDNNTKIVRRQLAAMRDNRVRRPVRCGRSSQRRRSALWLQHYPRMHPCGPSQGL